MGLLFGPFDFGFFYIKRDGGRGNQNRTFEFLQPHKKPSDKKLRVSNIYIGKYIGKYVYIYQYLIGLRFKNIEVMR